VGLAFVWSINNAFVW